MMVPDYITQCLTMSKEINFIVFLVDIVFLILPKVMILCAEEKNQYIQWLVIQWIGPKNKRN